MQRTLTNIRKLKKSDQSELKQILKEIHDDDNENIRLSNEEIFRLVMKTGFEKNLKKQQQEDLFTYLNALNDCL